MAAPPSVEDAEIARNRRTLYLIVAGVLSLLVPLVGVLYLKLSDNSRGGTPGSAGIVFSRRMAGDDPPTLNPAAAAAAASALRGIVTTAAPKMNSPLPVAAPESSARASGGSLSFLRGGEDYYGDGDTQLPVGQTPPQQQQAEAPAAGGSGASPAGAASPAAATTPAASPKTGQKAFVMPKLKPSSGFSDFKSRGTSLSGLGAPAGAGPAALQQQAAAAQAAGAGGTQQSQSAWKPASGPGSGANLPQLGQLGQKGAAPVGAAAATGAPGMPAMPDIGGLLKGMPEIPKEAGGMKMPDVGSLLNSIPGLGGDQKKK